MKCYRAVVSRALSLCVCVLLVCMPAGAADVKSLKKEAEKELRNSQKMMHNGKFEESLQLLEKAGELLEQMKAADPDAVEVKIVEGKYAKQKKDLERRMPKKETTEPEPAREEVAAGGTNNGDLTALAKEADKALRDAQRLMFNSKFEESQELLTKAGTSIEQIKHADPSFAQLKSLESKYEKQKKDLERRVPKDRAETAPEPGSPGKTDESANLPGGVTYRLKDVDKTVQSGHETLTKETAASNEWRIQTVEGILESAKDLMDEVVEGYGDQIPEGHPDMQAAEEKITELERALDEYKANNAEQQAQAAQADAEREALSQEWLAKLTPYILGKGGEDKSKELIGGGTSDVEELVLRKAIYTEALALFEEYQNVEFPHGKSEELEMAAKELAYNLKGFEEGYQESIDRFASEAHSEIERTEKWLDDQEAKIAAEEDRNPVFLSSMVISGIERNILALEASTGGEDARLGELQERLAAIESRAEGLRKVGIERTFMLADKFSGAESESIKTNAVEFLKKEYADAEPLRSTIVDGDWREEEVLEYTDTTKSAIRYRVTRSVTVQIAAKRGAEVFLYSIHVAKDHRSDGSWGELYGHVMFIDPMLEENVEK